MKCIFVLFLEQNLLKGIEWVQSKGKAIAIVLMYYISLSKRTEKGNSRYIIENILIETSLNLL